MPTFSYKGYDFEVDHTPSEQEFAQMSAYVDTLPPKEEKKPKEKAGIGTGIKSSFASVGNMADTALSTLAGSAAALFGDDKEAVRIADEMEQRRQSRNQWANPNNEELGLGAKVAGTLATLPMQVVGMGLSPAETTRVAKESGETNTAAIRAGLIDAAGNAAGIAIPGFKQGSTLMRMGSGAAVNAAQELAAKKAIQMSLDTEKGKAAFEPTMEDAAVAAIVGGGLGAASRGQPKQSKPTTNAAKALADLKARKVTPKAPALEPEQLRLFDQFEERSPVSPYQTEMAPDMWRVDENGIPIRADLSMELQNLQEPLQRNLFGDELDANFPRDPNKPLNMETGDIEGVERFSDPVQFRNDPEGQIPLTEAIDAMPEGVRARNPDGSFAGGTTRQNALDLLRGEMEADPALEVGKMEADGPKLPLGSKARKEAFLTTKRKTQGGVIHPSLLTFGVDGLINKIKEAGLDQPSRRLLGAFTGTFKKERLIDAYNESLDPKSREQVYLMSPNEFLTLAKKRMSWDSQGKESSNKRDSIKKGLATKEGLDDIPYLMVDDHGQVIGHEGRHRSDVLGGQLDKIPVRIISTNHRNADGPLPYTHLKAQDTDGFKSTFGEPLFTTDNRGEHGYIQSENTKASPPTFNSKKQSGGVLFDWKKKNEVEQLAKVAGIKDKLAAFVPTEMDAEGTIELARQGKDVDQNMVQKVINQFTKGGLYQAEKTGNPIVKFTVDKVLNADRKARADVRDYIHDSLAPAMRALSTQEMIDVAAILNQADMDQVPVDSNFLRQYGFSDKQIAFAEAHRATMDKAFEAINKAREAVGKEPIDKRVSYAAMAATGDFRKLVYKMSEDGVKEVVGIIGANTRRGLSNVEKKLAGKDYIFGEERFAGGAKRGASDVQAIMDVLEHLSENNPSTKDFLDVLSDLKAQDAYNFVNMSKHTKQKKGVFGMEGRKEWVSELQNAKDFMDAQLKYAESALRWGHLSDAATEVKKVLSSDVDQPNAKKWAEGYFNNALGLNPSETGRSFERAMDSFWKETGVGKTIPSNIQQYSRKIVNTLLLGLNPAFLATNVVQPLVAMPAMNAFLKSRGLDENSLMTLGYDSMAQAGFTLIKEKMGKLSPLEAGAAKYARENHVFGTDLVDTSSVSRKNAEFYLDKTGNFLASNVEAATRQMVYYGFVHMLDKNGMGKEFGLAQNLTDLAMNNYSPVERPNVFNMLGPVGDLAANLSSFKHNELSRLAMFAREIGKEGTATPLLMQLATGVAAAGVTGSIAFAEADWLYRQITKALGKPDSLTNVAIQFSESMADKTKNPYAVSHGIFSYMGLDMSKRLGLSDVIPNSVGEALFPGGGKLVDVAGAGLSAVTSPNEMNFKRLAREASPGLVTGPMDREWFSQQTPQGELALNRRTLEGQVIRNDADKMAKNFGFTGINESVQKQKLWDVEQQRLGYSELRTGIVKKMATQMFTRGNFDEKLIDKYLEYEGDIKTLETELENRVKKQEMSAVDALKMKALAAKKIPQLQQGQRVMETFR